MIYFLLLILFFLSLNYEITGFKKGKNILIFTIIFILAFSYQMGVDWLRYQDFYENVISKMSFVDILKKEIRFEKGYILLNFIFYNLGFNYEMFMGTLLSTCIYIFLNFIYKKSENYYLSFFAFIVFYLLAATFEPVIRQLIVISLITYGFKYIERREQFKYLVLIVFAFFFHKSAIIGIVIYFLPLLKIKIKNIFLTILIVYFFILYMPFILELIVKIIPRLGNYSNYFDSIMYGASRKKNFLGKIYSLTILCGYSYIIFYCYKYSKKRNNLYENMAIIYIIIGCFQNMLPIVYRVREFFVLGFSICIGSVGKLHLPNNKIIKFNHKKLGFLFVIIAYIPLSLVFFRGFFSELNKVRYLNYRNYFIEMIKGDLKENFKEKSSDYERIIDQLIRKEINKKKEQYL